MRVRAIATAVPDWRVGNDLIRDWSGLDPAFVEQKIGVVERRFLRHTESGTELARQACDRLFEENPALDRDAIGMLILVTQNPDYRLPHGAGLLQAALGLNKTVASFDLALGCSGYVYGLGVARAFMASEDIGDALLVTCDPYSKVMRRESREVIGVFGDGATATWLSRDRGATIGKGDYGTDGTGAKDLIVRSGGAAHPAHHLDGAEGAAEAAQLGMNGRAVFSFMMTRVPETLARCLDRNRLTMADVDCFVFHQASRYLLETLIDQLDLPADKVPIRLENTGNTVSSSIPMVLASLKRERRGIGRTVLLCGFGVGLSWATNLLFFGDES